MKNFRIIILVLLAVTAIFIWSSIGKKPKMKNSGAIIGLTRENLSEPESSLKFWNDKPIKKRQFCSYKNFGRDPFALGKGVTYLSGLNLMGIFWEAGLPQAIINEKIVKVNDTIDGNRVLEIRNNNVVLSDGKNKIELKLWSDSEANDLNK